jgi:D-aminopeptidase
MKRRHFLRTSLVAASAPILGGTLFEATSPTWAAMSTAAKARPRLRDLGIIIGSLPTARYNAITDVAGVRVGHATLIHGEGALVAGKGPIRTGVTVIQPHGGDVSRDPVRAADWTLNGNGELTGLGPLRRHGLLGSPIFFTDTGCVGTVYDAAMGHLLELNPQLFSHPFRPEPVVAETWAGFLNDTAGRHVGANEVRAALANAAEHGDGEVAEGSVGGGTGMRAYGFKAGIGTSSRVISCEPNAADASPNQRRQYTVGVLVQANHGRRHQLTVQGIPVGAEITDQLPTPGKAAAAGHSLLIAIATDAPLLPIQLQRLCKRAALGMARTGGISTHGSGDLSIAFSTAKTAAAEGAQEMLHFSQITQFHQAVVEATEEAILNALTAAQTMVGRDGNRIFALPLERFIDVMRRHGRLK